MSIKNTPNYKKINDIMDETMDKALHQDRGVPSPKDVMDNVYPTDSKKKK